MSFFCEQNSDFVISQSRFFATSSIRDIDKKSEPHATGTCGSIRFNLEPSQLIGLLVYPIR